MATVGVGSGIVAGSVVVVESAFGADGDDEFSVLVVASLGDAGSVDVDALLLLAAAAASLDSMSDRRIASMIISSSRSAPMFRIAVGRGRVSECIGATVRNLSTPNLPCR